MINDDNINDYQRLSSMINDDQSFFSKIIASNYCDHIDFYQFIHMFLSSPRVAQGSIPSVPPDSNNKEMPSDTHRIKRVICIN